MSNSSPPQTLVPVGAERSGSRKELAWVFLRLGTTAFGGPAAHIAIMEDEFVRRRGWLTREKFLDLLGAANLIPGPSSTELAIYIGYQRAGWSWYFFSGLRVARRTSTIANPAGRRGPARVVQLVGASSPLEE